MSIALIRCYIECWQDYLILAGIITAVMGVVAILVAIYWDFVAENWLALLVLTMTASLVLFLLIKLIWFYIGLWFVSKFTGAVATIILLLFSPAIIGFVMWVVSWDWVWIFYNMSTILLCGVAGFYVVGMIAVVSNSKPFRDKTNEEMAKNSQVFHAKKTGLIP